MRAAAAVLLVGTRSACERPMFVSPPRHSHQPPRPFSEPPTAERWTVDSDRPQCQCSHCSVPHAAVSLGCGSDCGPMTRLWGCGEAYLCGRRPQRRYRYAALAIEHVAQEKRPPAPFCDAVSQPWSIWLAAEHVQCAEASSRVARAHRQFDWPLATASSSTDGLHRRAYRVHHVLYCLCSARIAVAAAPSSPTNRCLYRCAGQPRSAAAPQQNPGSDDGCVH